VSRRRREIVRVCGLDEAGRGALAGPLVLAGVAMASDFEFGKVCGKIVVRDSKKLSERQRLKVFDLVESYSLCIDVEVISVAEVNSRGIGWANLEGFRRLITRIEAAGFIVDGRGHLWGLGRKAPLVQFIVDADETIPTALAAGIVAKVKRDEIMRDLHLRFPVYGWETNTGHGTMAHISAIQQYGVCEHHRLQFVETALRNSIARRRA
jgi:ribonuclease HII